MESKYKPGDRVRLYDPLERVDFVLKGTVVSYEPTPYGADYRVQWDKHDRVMREREMFLKKVKRHWWQRR